jgi:hypothetical protein
MMVMLLDSKQGCQLRRTALLIVITALSYAAQTRNATVTYDPFVKLQKWFKHILLHITAWQVLPVITELSENF